MPNAFKNPMDAMMAKAAIPMAVMLNGDSAGRSPHGRSKVGSMNSEIAGYTASVGPNASS